MSRPKRSSNVEIGYRLRTAREKMKMSQAAFAEVLDISDEHYRRLENGSSALTVEKIICLYEKYGIDPSYLVVGKTLGNFDLDLYLTTCSKQQKEHLMRCCMEYAIRFFVQ